MLVSARAGIPTRALNFKSIEGGLKDGGSWREQSNGKDSRGGGAKMDINWGYMNDEKLKQKRRYGICKRNFEL